MKASKLSLALAALLAMTISGPISAAVTFTGSVGARAASVTFDIVSGQLHVVLDNTSASDALVPTDILTAVFFNVAGNPTLSKVSATSLGPTYLNGGQVSLAGTAVGGEWAYLNGLNQYGANAGISSIGTNIFGPGDRFPGSNLAGPDSPNGLQYGLTTAGDNLTTDNGGLAGNEVTKHSVEFVLGAGLTSAFLNDISNVTFQYGTSVSEPSVPGGGGGGGGGNAPEPASLTLVGVALAAAGFTAKRRRKS